MALEVIGAGFGRTGTLSLKLALEHLGYARCYHMLELRDNPNHMKHWWRAAFGDPVDWPALLSDYRAAVDWPACSFWRRYRELWPDARVILTTRDAGDWYDSVCATIYPSSTQSRDSDDAVTRERAQFQRALIWDGTFGGRFEDREHAVGVFESHNRDVQAQVPRDQLLVLTPGDGWGPLCEFLGRPVPDEPYPNTNSRREFGRRWQP